MGKKIKLHALVHIFAKINNFLHFYFTW